MATSCTIPVATIHGAELCPPGSQSCVAGIFDYYKSPRDGKWYQCHVDVMFPMLHAGSCMNDPTKRVSDEFNARLDAWAAGNTAGSSTPPVTDPVLTDTPTTPPPPTTTTFD
jgi:hypothetical protein